MSDTLNKSSMMSVYPSVLDKDALFNALGQSAAEAIGAAFIEADKAGIYTRIDQLDEGILDILAHDFNISWYDYDYQLETKRRVIAAAFAVHRRMGTRGAMVKAICAIWPNSTVEEWPEYGGDPYYFRVLVEANKGDSGEPIHFDSIDKTVQLYKNERSWLQDGKVVLRIYCGIVINTSKDGQFFHPPACGTLPRVSTHGNVNGTGVIIGTEHGDSRYHPVLAGQSEAGVNPAVSTHGDVADGGLTVGASFGAEAYTPIPCGTPLGSLM